MTQCKTLGCEYVKEQSAADFCDTCLHTKNVLSCVDHPLDAPSANEPQDTSPLTTSYYGEAFQPDHPDVYEVHHRFEMTDPSGALHQASRTLLLCSLPENFSDQYAQVIQARDLLNRWLELNLPSTE